MFDKNVRHKEGVNESVLDTFRFINCEDVIKELCSSIIFVLFNIPGSSFCGLLAFQALKVFIFRTIIIRFT